MQHIDKKKDAKFLFSKAVSILVKIGGIGAFEAPRELGTFVQAEASYLTPQERKNMAENAVKYLKKAIELNESLEGGHHFLGVAYLLADEPDKATVEFRIAVNEDLQRKTSYVYLCSLLWNAHKFEEVNRLLKKFSKEFPEEKIKFYLLQGTTYYKQGKYKKAVVIANNLIKLDDTSIAGLYLLASAYFLSGDGKRAEHYFGRIVELNPQSRKEVQRMKEVLRKEFKVINKNG